MANSGLFCSLLGNEISSKKLESVTFGDHQNLTSYQIQEKAKEQNERKRVMKVRMYMRLGEKTRY